MIRLALAAVALGARGAILLGRGDRPDGDLGNRASGVPSDPLALWGN